MAMYTRLLILVLTNIWIINFNIFAIDVVPEGTLVTEFNSPTKNPTVKMYMHWNVTPIIKITAGTPTIVQFPEEINICQSANKLVMFDYGDKVTSKADSNSNTGDWYSSISLSLNPDIIKSIPVSALLKMPPHIFNCKIRVSSPDSKSSESYRWQSIGAKIVNPNDAYFIVYLLKLNSLNVNNGTDNLFSQKEIERLPYIDITKMKKDITKPSDDSSNFISKKKEEIPSIKDKNKSNNNFEDKDKKARKEEKEYSILDLYEFKDTKIKKSEVKKI